MDNEKTMCMKPYFVHVGFLCHFISMMISFYLESGILRVHFATAFISFACAVKCVSPSESIFSVHTEGISSKRLGFCEWVIMKCSWAFIPRRGMT